MRLDAVHTLRATPRHHASGVPGGAAACHATRDGTESESCCLMAVRLARSRWLPSATRGALSPPQKKSGPLLDATLSVALRGGRG